MSLQVFSKVGAVKSCTVSKKKSKAGIYPLTPQERFLQEPMREGEWDATEASPLCFPSVTTLSKLVTALLQASC